MTESSRFFSDGTYYTQVQFAQMIKDMVTNGYVAGVGSEFAVSAQTPTAMSVKVGTGRAYINGYIHEIETDPVSLTVSASESKPRIDLVVARLSTSDNRNVRVAIKKGTAATSPSEPALTQTDATWEVKIAAIAVAANATSITSSNITYAYTRATNLPLGLYPQTSKTAYGFVKIGGGIDVSDGVISLEYGSYPMRARLYTTDQGFGGYFILANVYQGTLGTKQSGLVYQNDTESTTRSLSFTATARNTSASGSTTGYSFTFKAKDVLTLVERTLGTVSGTGDGGAVKTHTVTYDVKLTEIITYTFTDKSSYNWWSGSISVPDNNIYLGRPT